MKKSSKGLLAILLAAILTLSAIATIVSFAAETDQQAAAAEAQAPEAEEEAGDVGAQAPEEIAAGDIEGIAAPPTMAKVTGITKTSCETDRISLAWNKVSGVTGYTVYYWSVDYDTYYKKLGDFTGTSATAYKLIQGSPYTFKVAPYTVVGGKRFEGEPTVFATCTQLTHVNNLRRTRSSTVIEISWDRNYKAQAYRIYRTSAQSDYKEVFIGSVIGSHNTSFTDYNVKYGYNYTYNVVPARTVANHMFMGGSNRILCRPGLGAPDFSGYSTFYRGFLSWNRSQYATRYDVYMSLNPNGSFSKIGSSTNGSFVTDKLPGGRTVYFRVFPVYASGNTTIYGTYYTKSLGVSGQVMGRNVGTDTYVEINISMQHMWYYKNGKLIVSTDVVTGNKNSMDTPKGFHSVVSMARNTVLSGANYSSFVSYWIGFLGSGYGIHDASWRDDFGGDIYNGNGSHGCVNTPYYNVQKIYNNITYGTPVIIY